MKSKKSILNKFSNNDKSKNIIKNHNSNDNICLFDSNKKKIIMQESEKELRNSDSVESNIGQNPSNISQNKQDKLIKLSMKNNSSISSSSKEKLNNLKSHSKESKEIHKEGKVFGRFYEKYSQNLKEVLLENKNDIYLIGNERFRDQDVNYLINEMENKHLHNKFNEDYKIEKEEFKLIEKILTDPNSNLTPEQKKYLIEKSQKYQVGVELTPLPVASMRSKESSDIHQKENLKKAERSAIIMRRFEYEKGMKKINFEKKSKSKSM